MKKIMKFLFLLIVIIPVLVNASTYSDATEIANSYYKQFLNPDRYLVKSTHLWNLDNNGIATADNSFTYGGLITKREVNISSKGKSTSFSYMFDGTKFWALKKNIIGEEIKESTNNNDSYKTKVTEYVKHETKVIGIGTYENPYLFVDSYHVTINVKGKGKIQYEEESPVKNITKPVGAYDNISFILLPDSGYKYLNNSCESISSKSGNKLTFNRVQKDLTCEVVFTEAEDSVTLNPPCEDVTTELEGKATYCFRSTETNTFYYRQGVGYYQNEDLTVLIGELLYPPFLTGWTFDGYTIEDDKDFITPVTKDGRTVYEFEKTNQLLTKDNKGTIKGHGHANTYTISFDEQGGSGGSSTKSVVYVHDIPPITLPGLAGYVFQGYYTETGAGGTQYYKADGSAKNIWREAHDTTLYASWKKCRAGYYCPGDNTENTCPSGYTSVAGSDSIHDCYNYARSTKVCYQTSLGTYTAVGHTCVLGASGWYYNTYTKTGQSWCHASSQDCACTGSTPGAWDGCGYYSSCTPEVSYGFGSSSTDYTLSCSKSSWSCNSSHVNWTYTSSCSTHYY